MLGNITEKQDWSLFVANILTCDWISCILATCQSVVFVNGDDCKGSNLQPPWQLWHEVGAIIIILNKL